MSLRIDDDAPLPIERDSRAARKLALARRTPGSGALVWMLLGFLMGAGAAVAVLTRADFSDRAPPPLVRVRLTPLVPAPQALPAPAAPPVAPSAATLAGVAPVAVSKASATKASMTPPAARPPPPSPQVVEDAAATGMTSRGGAHESDLY
jgi:hypothetical protein